MTSKSTEEKIQAVLDDYLTEVDPEEVDTQDLAENIARALADET